MVGAEILKKALEEAIKNGYTLSGLTNNITYDWRVQKDPGFGNRWTPGVWCKDDLGDEYILDHRTIFFDHEFVHAFAQYILADNKMRFLNVSIFPKKHKRHIILNKISQTFLSQLALSPNRLEYIKQFL